MLVSAQISLYPLRQTSLSPAIDKTLTLLRERGLEVAEGPMSTIVSGDHDVLFDGLRDAFKANADEGGIVMVATFSNACPL